MKNITMLIALLCGMLPLSAIGQAGIADPITGNASIDFYGRVVDQDGQPVSAAKVVLKILVGYLASPTQLGTRYDNITLGTDTGGNFVVTGEHGHSVEIVSIEKDDYELSKRLTRLYPYSWSAEIFHPDKNNPVLFVLWEKGKQPALIVGDKSLDFIPDGRSYAVDLGKKTITQATNSEGDFQFRLLRPGGVGKFDKFDWTFSLQGENGNLLQQSKHRYFEMGFSPKEGFTNSYQETHRASDQGWREVGHKQFYLKMHEGGGFGKATLIWEAVAGANGPGTNEAAIRIQYTLNPNGAALEQ